MHSLCSPGRLNEGMRYVSPAGPLRTCSLVREGEQGHQQDNSVRWGLAVRMTGRASRERSLRREFLSWWGRGAEDPRTSVELKWAGRCKGEMLAVRLLHGPRDDLCVGLTLKIVGPEGPSQIRWPSLPCAPGKWEAQEGRQLRAPCLPGEHRQDISIQEKP